MAVKPCDNCGTELTRPASHFRGTNTFCDRECRKAFHRPAVACAGCPETFPREPKFPGKSYCSWECFKASRWVEVTCAACAVVFKVRVSEEKKRAERGNGTGVNCCSIACRNRHTASVNAGGVLVLDEALLYLVRNEELGAIKVGIALSNRRVAEHARHGWQLLAVVHGTGADVWALERAVLGAWATAGVPVGFVPAAQMPQKGHTETAQDAPAAVQVALNLIHTAQEIAA